MIPLPMRRLLPLLLLSTSAGTALAGPETLSTCVEDPVAVVRWSPPGADSVACHQTVVGAWIDGQLAGRNGEKMAAFGKGTLVAIRPGDDTSPGPADAPTYQPGDWLEKGSTGIAGELWWGRTALRHVFVGQEAHVRQAKANKYVPAALRPALQDFMIRRMMAAVQKQGMASKPGDERFKVFTRERIDYAQHAATMATFDGGLGGDGNIVPGRVANARLELQTQPLVKGLLRFDLAIDGEVRQFAIPVRAASENDHLRATKSGADTAPECSGVWRAGDRVSAANCIVPNGAKFEELYEATGAFFGDHAGLAAVHFRLRVNSAPRNRIGATAVGVIVLKAQ